MTSLDTDSPDSQPGSFNEAPVKDLFAGGTAMPKTIPVPSSLLEPDPRLAHRVRLRRRFMEGGAAAMPDCELLELILFRALPRGDVKPLAKRLLHRFGDLNRAFQSDRAAGPVILGHIAWLPSDCIVASGDRTISRVVPGPQERADRG